MHSVLKNNNFSEKLQNFIIQLCQNKMINQEMELIQKYGYPPQNFPTSRHRTHGLSQNLSMTQFFAFILIISEILVYFLCIHKLLQSIPFLVIYSFFGMIGIIASGLATLHNPTDWIVYYYKNSDKNKGIHFKYSYKDLRFCSFCDSYCFKSSKHCRQCNRCVQNFDHHCIWFNNCVGKSNYKYFFIGILSLFIHLSLYIAQLVVATVYQASNNFISDNLGVFIAAWIIGAILFIFDILLVNLLALHFYLIYEGITTYQFLIRDNKDQSKNNPFNTNKNKVFNTPLSTQVKIHNQISSATKKQTVQFQKIFSQERIQSGSLYSVIKQTKPSKQLEQQIEHQNQTSYTNLNSQIIVVKQKKTEHQINEENKAKQINELKLEEKLRKITQQDESNRVMIKEEDEKQPQKQYFSKIQFPKRNQKNSKKDKTIEQKTKDQMQFQNSQFQYKIINSKDIQNSQSDARTVKSIQIKQKNHQKNHHYQRQNHFDGYQMNDQILSNQNGAQKSIQSHQSDVKSQKTIKKQCRMKTYVTYTRNQKEIYQNDQKQQKMDGSPSQNRLHRLQNYLRKNRSLKIILNGDQPEAYSPIRLPRRQKKQKQPEEAIQNKKKQNKQSQFYFNQSEQQKKT